MPIAHGLNQGQVDPRGIGGVDSDDDLLAPGRVSELLEHLLKQGIFRLIAGIVLTLDYSETHRETLDVPLGHQNDDLDAEDIGVVLT
jgi:hypothetical protein